MKIRADNEKKEWGSHTWLLLRNTLEEGWTGNVMVLRYEIFMKNEIAAFVNWSPNGR